MWETFLSRLVVSCTASRFSRCQLYSGLGCDDHILTLWQLEHLLPGLPLGALFVVLGVPPNIGLMQCTKGEM